MLLILRPSCQLALIVVDVVTPGVMNLKARLAGMYFSTVTLPDMGSVGQVPAVPTTPSCVVVERKTKLPLVVSTPLVGVYSPVTFNLLLPDAMDAPEALLILMLFTVPVPLICCALAPFSSNVPEPEIVPLFERLPDRVRLNEERLMLVLDASVRSAIETLVERIG